jgi:imidazoleglycerol-phosphate dehydratase
MVKEFFYAVSYSAMINLHFVQMRGSNDHHITEAAFKSFAKSLDMATMLDNRIDGVLSTKGTI